MSTRPHARYGFTLLELLVVVAVIGLLRALLMPALSAANEAGRATVCATNLNQLFHGSFAYFTGQRRTAALVHPFLRPSCGPGVVGHSGRRQHGSV